MLLVDAVRYSGRNDEFFNILAKSILVTLYAEWDELYRQQQLAAELGVEAKYIKADLMGDLKTVRNWIIHNKSRAEKKPLKILEWSIREGEELRMTVEMLGDLVDRINVMQITLG